MAAAKKKKMLQYADKPMNRGGDRIYQGNLEDKYMVGIYKDDTLCTLVEILKG